MSAYQKAKCLLLDRGLGLKKYKNKHNINIGQNTHHNKRDTTLYKERPKTTT
jgi:hypothetical protein